jgi:hypothetical protein
VPHGVIVGGRCFFMVAEMRVLMSVAT